MSVRAAIKARLDAYAGLSALVGDRNYYGRPPQKPAFPCTAFVLIADTPHRAMGRDLLNRSPRVQVSAWARTPDDLVDVALEVRAALQDWSGSAAGVNVSRCLLESEVDLGFDHDGQCYGVAFDCTVHLA